MRRTPALTGLVPEYFPKAMREKAKRVLGVWEKVRCDHSSKLMSFPFDLLKPKECTALIQDILSLYEACLFDMTKEIKEIVRPDDQLIDCSKRQYCPGLLHEITTVDRHRA